MSSDGDIYFLEQVAEIDYKLDNCIREITRFLQSLETSDDGLNTDAIEEQKSKVLKQFLQETLVLLHDHPGLEAFILPHLGELRKQNGVDLMSNICETCKGCEKKNAGQMNFNDDELSYLWQQLCNHLEKFAFNQLMQYSKWYEPADNDVTKSLLKNYINVLQSIYVPSVVWKLHQKFRTQLLLEHKCKCLDVQFSGFNCLLKLCIQNICEDQLLIYTGDFQPVHITWTTLLNLYTEIVFEKLNNLLASLEEWASTKKQMPTPVSFLINSKLSEYNDTCCSCWIHDQINVENAAVTNDNCDLICANIVLQAIKALFEFEFQIKALVSNELDIKENMHLHEIDLSVISHGMSFPLPFDSPDPSPLHQNSTDSQDENIISFSEKWRILMTEHGYLTQLQRAVQTNVQNTVQSQIEKERLHLLSSDFQSLCSKNESYKLCSASIQIKTVLPSVLNTVKELERFLPLVATSDGSFFPFKASFSHTINSYVIDLIKHLEYIARGPPKNFVLPYLYVAGSSAIFLKERLHNYLSLVSNQDKTELKSPLSGICEAASQLVYGLTEEMFIQNTKYLSCGILFDAESYDFKDTNNFYEGERVSYSIQMWNLYMKSFLADIQFYLPQQMSQKLYARVLCESLMQLGHRYGQCSPSEARTPLIQFDILTLLFCTSELIYPACNSTAQFIGKVHREDPDDTISPFVTRIHSICCTLLSVLVVLASPLSELYKVFKKGFPVMSLSSRTKYSSIAPWLPWIRTTLFPEYGKRPLMSTVSVWLAVKICTSWLQPSPICIIKAFTEHYCTLSILLMTQATYVPDELTNKKDKLSPFQIKEQKVKLATSIFELLLLYKNSSNPLKNILLPVIERTNGWNEFDNSALEKTFNERPWWYQGLLQILNPFMKSILGGFIPVLLQCQKKCADRITSEIWKKLRNRMETLVNCTCEDDLIYYAVETPTSNNTSVPFVCITNILDSIDYYLITLPLSVRIFLTTLDAHIANYVPDIEPVQQSAPLQVLLSTIICYLKDPNLMKTLLGLSLSKEGISLCSLAADSLKKIVLKTQISIEISAQHITLMEKQLIQIKKHFEKLRSDIENSNNAKELDLLEEEAVILAASELIQQPNGSDIIIYLQKILCANESWIQICLGIPEMLSSDSVVSPISPSPFTDSGSVSESSHIKPGSASSNTAYNQRGSLSGARRGNSDTQEELTYDRNQQHPTDSNLHELELNDFGKTMRTSQYGLNLDIDAFNLCYSLHFDPFVHFNQLGDKEFNYIATSQFPLPMEALLSHLPILGLTEMGLCTLLSQRWDFRNEGPVTTEQAEWIQELKAKYRLT